MNAEEKLSETYKDIEEIGSGGGGTIYKAIHKRLNKTVVIKKIHEEVRGVIDSNAEANLLKNLRHTYLPQVLDLLTIDDNVYTVMDYIPGKSFQQLLDEKKRFSQKQVLKWAKQLCEALEYLHKQNPPIIHSDIKPANIMLMPNDDICLIDFNISSIFSKKEGARTIGHSDGYAPPEQYISFHDMAADVAATEDNADSPAFEKTEKADTYILQQEASELDKTEFLIKNQYQDSAAFLTSDKKAIISNDQNDTVLLSPSTEEAATEILLKADNTDRTMLLKAGNADQTMLLKTGNTDQTMLLKTGNADQIMLLKTGNADQTILLKDLNNQTEVATGSYEAQSHAPQKASLYFLVNERSDIYSLGATLYHLLTGTRPEKAAGKVAAIDSFGTRLSDGMVHIITKAMQRDPSKRYATASQMLKALNGISKLDSRYKHFMLLQELTFIFMMLLFAGSVLLIHHGTDKIKQEKLQLYDSYIADIREDRGKEEYDLIDKAYNNAVRLFPDRIEAYYERALSLYDMQEYETAIAYMRETVITNPELRQNSTMADIYFILANCYFEIEDYVNAIDNFKKAIDLNNDNSEYYRDYAISLARSGDAASASIVLKEAIGKGIADDSVFLIKGEIDLSKGDYLSGETNFTQCIRVTDNDYMKMRAYIMCGKMYDAAVKVSGSDDETGGLLMKKLELLKEARNVLPLDLTLGICESLIQAYIDCGTFYNDNSYYENAISVSEDMVSMHWDTYNTHNNMVILYQKIGNLEEAASQLDIMLDEFGEDYNIYKRWAYLELDIQSQKLNEDRDYDKFSEYYRKAVTLYKSQVKNNMSDVEMSRLDELYIELAEGGWFE